MGSYQEGLQAAAEATDEAPVETTDEAPVETTDEAPIETAVADATVETDEALA